MQKFAVTKDVSGPVRKVTFTGSLNEDSGIPLTRLALELSGVYDLDLSGVSVINSIGVSNWLQFLKSAKGKAVLRYVRCSSAVQSTLHMVPALLSGISLLSFLADGDCNRCHTTPSVLIDAQLGKQFPKIKCSVCSGPLTFPSEDDIAELIALLEPA